MGEGMLSVLTGFPMRRLTIAILAVLPWLVACTPPDFPGDRVFGDGGTLTIPALEPIDTFVSGAAPDDGDTTARDLQDRGDRLRARADTLRSATP